jgi:hypothetical protein
MACCSCKSKTNLAGGVDRTLPQGVSGDDHEPSIEELLTDTTAATITT